MSSDPQHEPYLVERIREALALDARVNELGIVVTVAGSRVFLTGWVANAERQRGITEVVRESFPGLDVCNDVKVQEVAPPGREVLE
jgi:osmotically-inducible protein OsmY